MTVPVDFTTIIARAQSHMVSGPAAFICNECVGLCVGLMQKPPPAPPSGIDVDPSLAEPPS